MLVDRRSILCHSLVVAVRFRRCCVRNDLVSENEVVADVDGGFHVGSD